MKRMIIQGEVGQEIKKQIQYCDALGNAINEIAQTKDNVAKMMWKHINKEFPLLSKNCTLSIIDDEVILIDRLGDIE